MNTQSQGKSDLQKALAVSALDRHNEIAGKMSEMREEMWRMTGELLNMKEAVFAEFRGKSLEERMLMFDTMPDSEVTFQLFRQLEQELNELNKTIQKERG